MTRVTPWAPIPLSKLFRKRREGDAVPSSREHAPDRATTVPRVRRDDSSGRRITLASHDTDGVILVPPELASVGAINWAGGLAATEHLLNFGHRRIAAIAGPEDYLCSRARIGGYRSALERAGVGFDPALVRHGDFQHEGGFRCGGELLDLADRPTAIFAGSDHQALGVYEAARQRGLRIPQDLSVAGFDDLPVARWVSPPLTTVRQPLAEMGRAAAQMLGEIIEDRPLRSRRVELSTELIMRESTGPVPGTAR